MQFEQHHNIETGAIPQQLNHGAHEVLDVHEVLGGAINTLNTYTMLGQYVQDPELRSIIERQKQFMTDEYNTTVECFQTGQDPAVPTQSYKMAEGNDFTYGLKPTQPKQPIQSAAQINDEVISCNLLYAVKGGATAKTMAALESTNPVVRRVLADSLPNCIEMAYEISLYQNKHGYYQVPQLAQQDMQQIQNGYAPVSALPPLH
ncbi:spore coat protein ['Paenibacillus yunnanensis' Narsing Rao et al. 2020]|uniref:spore coat protein n=1 Tax=Paenibacillus tengchongensis TaxID=2608684 RepID=UPI00124D4959|nr:spore coat protein [Paenibacillus tengchongensis]